MERKRRVRLFPGVTVPRNIALAVKYGIIENGMDTDADPWAKSPNGLGRIDDDSEVANIVEDVESFLRRKREKGEGERWLRRHREFGPRNYHYRRRDHHGRRRGMDTNPRGRPYIYGPLFQNEIEHLLQGIKLPEDKHWGTNQILEEVLGLHGESARTEFLRRLGNGNLRDNDYGCCIEAAYTVRAAFHLAQFYGLDYYAKTPQQERRMLKAIINCVHESGAGLTDLLLQCFNIMDMPDLMARYTPTHKFGLVPKGTLYQIVSAREEMPRLKQLDPPDLMYALGYKALTVEGIPVLYYMPKLR